MQQFFAGVGAGLVVAAVVWIVLERRSRRQAAERQASAGQAIEELARLTGELAHEIKNPLSTVKVNLQLAREELEDAKSSEQAAARGSRETGIPRAARKIAVVQKETDRLENILDGFLRYVRKPELEPVPTDINGVISDMVDFYLPQAHAHSITLRQSLNPQPLVCRIDVGALKQVLLNLFVNAQQAMEVGGELMVRTGRQGNQAMVQVSDTGRGIPQDKLATIFEPFYSFRPGGTGLGLPIAKKIIAAHGGQIDVHSEQGKGSCFFIRLPLIAGESASRG